MENSFTHTPVAIDSLAGEPDCPTFILNTAGSDASYHHFSRPGVHPDA